MTLVSPHTHVTPQPSDASDTALRHPDLVAAVAAAFAVAAVFAAALPYALICSPALALVAVGAGLTSLGGSGHGHRLGRTVALLGVVVGSLVLVAAFASFMLLARLTL